ncbi:response regulator [Roseococcus sp. SDR]|uniref:response regulator n=1 Tax=Roseococcus sp. SDR TaxID=2835532 RepID=UPI001BCD834C|nr:response regulator [Roseococcus sp. SDR]MBS7791711.1 response regulator [Roseococcus sp. SDR]MBV1847025.1 response regulator [Roseococcus sp. SDR]
MTRARTALVVDDATTMRKFHRSVLEQAGFAVSEAMDGVAALEQLLEAPGRFGLVLADVNMPGLDGYALVGRIRAEPALAALPVIMITTEREPRDAARGFAAGANLFLVKPVRPERLAAFALAIAAEPAA